MSRFKIERAGNVAVPENVDLMRRISRRFNSKRLAIAKSNAIPTIGLGSQHAKRASQNVWQSRTPARRSFALGSFNQTLLRTE
jgi:hypothetical protein